MAKEDNLIAVEHHELHDADRAFAEFMLLTEQCLNAKTRSDRRLFKNCSGTELEAVALNALREVAPQTPFAPEGIELVSGARFPDIQAARNFGVEVKSTKSDHWKSTGSSIVETTRIKDVSRIYMLFGKLGGEQAEFRCRPYEKCLSSIAVTHSPRYLIDMDLADNAEPDIFEQMHIDYNTFRLYDENKKVDCVRTYYKEKAARRGLCEMPWWLGGESSEQTSSITLGFYNDASFAEQQDIKTRMFILFPELFSRSITKYKRASLWLCLRRSLLCNNIRDLFTAGGQVTSVGSLTFRRSVPQVINTLYQCRTSIIALLASPDATLMQDIADYWPVLPSRKYGLSSSWYDMVQKEFERNSELRQLDIKALMGTW